MDIIKIAEYEISIFERPASQTSLLLIAELKSERAKVKKLEFMVKNGLGYEDLQQDSMQSHID